MNLADLMGRLRARNARIVAQRTAEAARTKGAADNLTALAEAVREWPRCDNCGGYPGNPPEPCIHPPRPLTLADHGLAWSPPEPSETYGQERLYDARDLVQVGLAMVHRGCRDARRDAATDHVCPACGQIFGRVAT